MAQVLLEDKNKVVDIPDGLTPQETEKQLRSFYTPEELYGATTFEEREAYRLDKGMANTEIGKNWAMAMRGEISHDVAKQMNSKRLERFTEENDEKYQASNWPERFVGATTELAPYMMDSAVQGAMYGEIIGGGFAGITLASGLGAPAAVPAYVGGQLVGQAYGSWKNAADVEGGQLYGTLIEDGIDPGIARAFAEPAGGVIGLIELFSVGHIFNKFIPSFTKKGITDFIKKAARKEMTSKGGQLLANLAKKGVIKTAGKVIGRTALEITEEQTQDNISFAAEVGAHLVTAMMEDEGYSGPGFDDWVQTNKDTFTSSLLSFPMLMLPGATFDTIKTHGRQKIANRVMTQRAKEALNLDLADKIAEATKFDNYKDFEKSLDVTIDNKYANQFGFDNRTTFAEAIYNESRDIMDEDKQIEEAMKPEATEAPIAQPGADLKGETGIDEPTAKGGEIVAKPATPEQKKGRITFLEAEQKKITKEIDDLLKQKAIREKEGKPTTAIDNQLQSLQEQNDALDQEMGEIITTENIKLSAEKIMVQAKKLDTISKEAKEAGVKEGKSEQKAKNKEKSDLITSIKKQMIDYANIVLPKSERGAFITAVANVKTQKQLQKQIERMNEYAADFEKRSLIKDIKKQVKKIVDSKSIAVDYIQKIQDFIDQYELKGHNEATTEKLRATKDFIEREAASGRNVEMPSYVLDALDILSRKPLNELTIPDLENIADKIDTMARLGKTKLRSRRAAEKMQKAKDLQAIKQSSKPIRSRKIKEGNAIVGRLNTIDNFLNGVKKSLNLAQMKDLMITPMDAVIDYLDGAQNYLGANYRIFKRRIDVAYSMYLNMKDDILKRADTKANELNLDKNSMERIGLHAVNMQAGGTEKLLSFFTQEQIDSVKLTDNEMAFYNFMRKELDALRPSIEKVMREVYNQPLGEVENYFPFMTDFEAMSDKEIRDRFGDKVTTHYDTLKKNVEAGFTKKRVGGNLRVKLNAADVFARHIDNAAYLINVGKETKYLGELAGMDEYGEAVGDVGQEVMREWIDLVARKGSGEGDRVKLLDNLRNYTGLVALGFKLSSALVQVTSLMDGATLIGTHAFKGFKNIITDAEWRAFVMENMPELRDRVGDDPAFQGFKDKNWKGITDTAYAPLKTIDKFAASGVAAGAYMKYCEDNNIAVDFNNPDPEAVAYAQKMMRRTQSSSQFKDLPLAVSKGKLTGNISVDKLILQFQSFMLNRWSLIRHDLYRAGIKGNNKKQAASIAMWLVAANFAELGIRKMTKEMIAALSGEELPEDDEDKEFYKNLGQILQNVPFIESLYYSILYGDLPIPSVSMLLRISGKVSSAAKADEDTAGAKWLKALLTSIPGGQQFEKLVDAE